MATTITRITIDDVIGTKGVDPSDYSTVAKLATVFYGLTWADSSPTEAKRFCIASAIRILGEIRTLIRQRGL